MPPQNSRSATVRRRCWRARSCNQPGLFLSAGKRRCGSRRSRARCHACARRTTTHACSSSAAGAGRGGSSSMPHKRNPALSMLALEAARRVPGLAATLLNQLQAEHERGVGQWQSQWLTLRELMGAAASAVAAMHDVLAGLEVNAQAMHANIERMQGVVFSEVLALRTSRALAERLIEQAVREKRHLRDVARADAEATGLVKPADMDALFEPAASYGAAPGMTQDVLSAWAKARESAL